MDAQLVQATAAAGLRASRVPLRSLGPLAGHGGWPPAVAALAARGQALCGRELLLESGLGFEHVVQVLPAPLQAASEVRVLLAGCLDGHSSRQDLCLHSIELLIQSLALFLSTQQRESPAFGYWLCLRQASAQLRNQALCRELRIACSLSGIAASKHAREPLHDVVNMIPYLRLTVDSRK